MFLSVFFWLIFLGLIHIQSISFVFEIFEIRFPFNGKHHAVSTIISNLKSTASAQNENQTAPVLINRNVSVRLEPIMT